MTRADGDRAHRQAVEENKTRIRGLMRKGEHVYGKETYHEARSVRDYAEVDALEELMPEIREHDRRLGGGTKSCVQEHLDQERRRNFQERQKRDAERSRAQVEAYSRTRPVPNFDATAAAPHGSAMNTHSYKAAGDVSDQERYEQQMREYEERRREARVGGWLFSEVPPDPSGKRKRTQPLLPY